VFIGVVATVGLTIAFFLLLVSTTANIRENVWEYGVLRSMGVTKSVGIRIFLYETLSVVMSAVFLGTAIGTCIAFSLAAQFYQFLELPFQISYPFALFGAMVGLALGTAIYGVVGPVSDINGR